MQLFPRHPPRSARFGAFCVGSSRFAQPKAALLSLPKTAQNTLLLAVLKSTGLGRNNLFAFILKINSSKLGWFKSVLYL
jgi:hypothetical protein